MCVRVCLHLLISIVVVVKDFQSLRVFLEVQLMLGGQLWNNIENASLPAENSIPKVPTILKKSHIHLKKDFSNLQTNCLL